jgi:hypothetical protein
VLLVGPAGSGKTAIIEVVRREGLLVVDPFAGITTPRAAALRRALNRGALVLGAARSLDPHDMGHAGRVSWRFERVYLRPLPPREIVRIVRQALDHDLRAGLGVDRRWLSAAVQAADGLPGRAVALASVVGARWRQRGVLLPPRFALLIACQEAIGRGFINTGQRPGESSS